MKSDDIHLRILSCPSVLILLQGPDRLEVIDGGNGIADGIARSGVDRRADARDGEVQARCTGPLALAEVASLHRANALTHNSDRLEVAVHVVAAFRLQVRKARIRGHAGDADTDGARGCWVACPAELQGFRQLIQTD